MSAQVEVMGMFAMFNYD